MDNLNLKDKKVIIAEDSIPNRNILIHLIKNIGLAYEASEDGEKVWQYLQQQSRQNLLLVLSDVMMPNKSGLELLQLIRSTETLNDLPFVLITAVSDKDAVFQARNLKANGYILKPVTFDKIKKKIIEIFPDIKLNQF